MRKTWICRALLMVICLCLAGCTTPGVLSSTSPETTLAPTRVPEPSAPEEAIAAAATVEELQTLMNGYTARQEYAMALLAVDKLIQLAPDTQDYYTQRAQIAIQILIKDYDTLNAAVAQDTERVSDANAYLQQVSQLYEEAELALNLPFTHDYTSPEEVNLVGSTAGNLQGEQWPPEGYESAVGAIAFQGDWIYYADPTDGFALCKMRRSGEERQRLYDGPASQINVIGDWIYFVSGANESQPYRILTDGQSAQALDESRCTYLCAAGNSIYFTRTEEGETLYRTDIGGNGTVSLNIQAASPFIDDGWLYYSSCDKMTLERMALTGGESQVILKNQWHLYTQIADGWIYYLTDNNGMVIKKVQPDGSGEQEVYRINGKGNCFTLAGNQLVVCMRSQDKAENILSLRLDTLEKALEIENSATGALGTDLDGNVYYVDFYQNLSWCRLDFVSGQAVLLS